MKILTCCFRYLAWILVFSGEVFGVPNFATGVKVQPHDIIDVPLISDQGIISEVSDLYRSGLRIPQISKHLKIAKSTVRSKLEKAGISLKEPAEVTTPWSKRHSRQPRWNSPYGFMYLDGKLAAHPQEFETLKLILQWSAAGQKYQTVANKLNVRKLRPRSAKQWNRYTIRQIVLWHAERPQVLSEVTNMARSNSVPEHGPKS